MRRVFVAAAILAALAVGAQAGEAGPGLFNVTVGGGINVPADVTASNGYIVVGGVGYAASSRLVIGGEVSYLGYPRDGGATGIAGSTPAEDPGGHFFDYMATGKYFVTQGRTVPYVKAFAGRYTYTLGGGPALGATDYSYSNYQYGGGLGLLVRGRDESNLYFEAAARRLHLEVGRTRIYTFTMGMDFSFPL